MYRRMRFFGGSYVCQAQIFHQSRMDAVGRVGADDRGHLPAVPAERLSLADCLPHRRHLADLQRQGQPAGPGAGHRLLPLVRVYLLYLRLLRRDDHLPGHDRPHVPLRPHLLAAPPLRRRPGRGEGGQHLPPGGRLCRGAQPGGHGGVLLHPPGLRHRQPAAQHPLGDHQLPGRLPHRPAQPRLRGGPTPPTTWCSSCCGGWLRSKTPPICRWWSAS